MRPSLRLIRAAMLGSALAFGAVAASSGGVLAYGSADQPLAQLTVAADCNNAAFPLCAPAPNGVGLGGIWLWIEIDQGGTADVAGAGCGHLKGVTAGAGSLRGTAPWWPVQGTPASIAAAYPGTFVVGTDPGGNYYLVPFGFAFPVTTGHYATILAPGVHIQATVAP